MKEKPYISTQLLVDALKAHESYEEFAENHKNELGLDHFKLALRRRLANSESDLNGIFARSQLAPSYAYQIFNGTRMPSRDKIIQLAFGLNLNLEEANTLLQSGIKQPLYAKIPRDSIIMFALIHQHSIEVLNQDLIAKRQTPLY